MDVQAILALLFPGGCALLATQGLDYLQKRATAKDEKAKALSDHMSAASTQMFDQQALVLKSVSEREISREQALTNAIARADNAELRGTTMREQLAGVRVLLIELSAFLKVVGQDADLDPHIRDAAVQYVPQIDTQIRATQLQVLPSTSNTVILAGSQPVPK